MKDIYRNLTIYKIDPKTSVFVLPPGSKKWRIHETSKRIAFTILQELPNKEFNFDNSFTIVNHNRYLVAVPKENVKLFSKV